MCWRSIVLHVERAHEDASWSAHYFFLSLCEEIPERSERLPCASGHLSDQDVDRLIANPPEDREEKLVQIMANIDQSHEQVRSVHVSYRVLNLCDSESASRNNFIALARHNGGSKTSHVSTEAQTGVDEDEELYAAFLTESDPRKDYSVNSSSFTDDQLIQHAVPNLSPIAQAQLERFEESAQDARKYYSDALARIRGQNSVATNRTDVVLPPRMQLLQELPRIATSDPRRRASGATETPSGAVASTLTASASLRMPSRAVMQPVGASVERSTSASSVALVETPATRRASSAASTLLQPQAPPLNSATHDVPTPDFPALATPPAGAAQMVRKVDPTRDPRLRY